jgi:uncharacterized protein YeaO (DUF488 family)
MKKTAIPAKNLLFKRAYTPAGPGDGKRILVDRLWPRGLKKDSARIDCWMKEIAPSTELRQWFGHDPERWPEFKRRYAKELAAQPEALEPLRVMARAGIVTLLFAAREEAQNNAIVLREFLLQSEQKSRRPSPAVIAAKRRATR